MESFFKFLIALVLVQQAIAIKKTRTPAQWTRKYVPTHCTRKYEPTRAPNQICPLNEKYNACGSACPLTCDNYANPPQMCTRNCVVGCQCEEGYVRNEADGSCCSRDECPAAEPTPEPTPEPQNCPLHEVYNDCGSACPLTCSNYQSPPEFCTMNCVIGCQCEEGYVRNEADGSCCSRDECPAAEPTPEPQNCPMNEVFDYCGSPCPLTCDNYESPPMCIESCTEGCRCEEGYVRNDADGSCCLPDECPAAEPTPEPTPEPQICPLNEKYNACGSACPLTCDNYKNPPQMCTMNCVVGCECEDDYVRNDADGSCCLREECPAAEPTPEPTPEPQNCPLNAVYNECGTACPLTCSNYQSPPKFCTRQCVTGCYCEEGYVKKGDGSCCLPEEC